MSDRGKVELLLAQAGIDEESRSKIDEYLDKGGDARGVFLGMALMLKWQRRLTEVTLTAKALAEEDKGYKRKITLDKYIAARQTHDDKASMSEFGLDVTLQALHKYEKNHPYVWMLLPDANEKIKQLLKESLTQMTATAEDKSKAAKKPRKKRKPRTK